MAYDPYYQQYQSLRSQEALTGRVQPTSPEALASILRGNISEDQNQQMKQEQISGTLQNQRDALKLQKDKMTQQTMASGIGGAASLALGAPAALKTLGVIGGKAAEIAPEAAAYNAALPMGGVPEGAGVAASATASDTLLSGTATGAAIDGTLTPVAGLTGTETAVASLATTTTASAISAETAAVTAAATVGEITADTAAATGTTYLLPLILGVLAWVLCSELVRQGKLAQSIVDQEWEHIRKILTVREYLGYRVIADPLVCLMQRSSLFSYLIAPWIRAFAYEMASRVNHRIKGNKFGAFLLWVGLPLCRMAYDWKFGGDTCQVY
jgi:hypothetical protein